LNEKLLNWVQYGTYTLEIYSLNLWNMAWKQEREVTNMAKQGAITELKINKDVGKASKLPR